MDPCHQTCNLFIFFYEASSFIIEIIKINISPKDRDCPEESFLLRILKIAPRLKVERWAIVP